MAQSCATKSARRCADPSTHPAKARPPRHGRSTALRQIKLRDISKASVSIAPAEFTSWHDARSDLILEAKKPLKAQLAAELGAAAPEEHESIRAEFASRERAIEHEIDHRPLDVHMSLGISYNVRGPALLFATPLCLWRRPLASPCGSACLRLLSFFPSDHLNTHIN